MNMMGVFGDCQLALTPSFEIVCALMPSQQVAGVWSLDCLRTFSYGNGMFSFEAGRHAPHGPGEYSFITQSDHLIHGRLLKQIEKAKRNSSSSSSSRLSNLMDNRPPARLPFQDRESSSDSPGNSDTDEKLPKENIYMGPPRSPELTSPVKTTPPPLPDVPPPKIPPKGLTTPDYSLHHQKLEQPVDSVGRFLQSGAATQLSPTDETGDHMYSHTMHTKPGSTRKTVSGSEIYNSLVHDGVKSRKASNYEMAYPEPKTSIPIEGSSNVVYDTAYNETDGHQKQPTLVNLPPPPVTPGSLTEGMTANPLYGSKGNLLEDIMSNNVFNTIPPESGSPPLPPKPKSLSSSPESNKLPKPSHPDVTANPVYVTSALVSSTSPTSNGHSPPGVGRHSPSAGIGNHSPPVSTIQKENVSQQGDHGGPNYIKGYSRVNKHISESFQETFIPGSMDSDPPPIPDRLGSFNED